MHVNPISLPCANLVERKGDKDRIDIYIFAMQTRQKSFCAMSLRNTVKMPKKKKKKEKQQIQNGVACAKPHVSKPRHHT